MNKMVRIVCSFCVVMAMTPLAHATNGMRMIGAGPVQESIAGVGTALPLDSAAVATNPAGIRQLDRRLDVSVTCFVPEVAYTAHSESGMVAHDGIPMSSRTGPCWIPAVGMILPLNDRLTLGASLQGACGMGVDYPQNLYYGVTYTQYELMKLLPGIAYSLSDRLSVGVALSVNYARMEYHAGSALEVPHTDGEAFGLGATVGTLYKLTDRISAGLAYETRQSFTDFEFHTVSGLDTLRLDQPQSIAAGLGVHPTKRLRGGLDVVWIDWPQTVGWNMPAYRTNSSGAAPWNMNWDEQIVYRLGLELDLPRGVALRAGYNYGKNPLDSTRAFENIAFPAIAEHHFTAGFGIPLRHNLIVNAAFVYAPEVTRATANAAQFIDSATTRMSQYAVDVGLALKW